MCVCYMNSFVWCIYCCFFCTVVCSVLCVVSLQQTDASTLYFHFQSNLKDIKWGKRTTLECSQCKHNLTDYFTRYFVFIFCFSSCTPGAVLHYPFLFRTITRFRTVRCMQWSHKQWWNPTRSGWNRHSVYRNISRCFLHLVALPVTL